jgi:hypothetical protein
MKAYDYENEEIFSGKLIKIGDLTPFILELWKNWGAKHFRVSGEVKKNEDE